MKIRIKATDANGKPIPVHHGDKTLDHGAVYIVPAADGETLIGFGWAEEVGVPESPSPRKFKTSSKADKPGGDK